MHLFKVAFFVSGALFALFNRQELLFNFFLVFVLYILLSVILPGTQNISNRKKIMLSTWTQPSQGIIQVKVPIRTQKVQQIMSQYSREGKQKLTFTHFVLKACGQLMSQGRDLNGKYVFGKFIPYEKINISCLVDIDGGKDLAVILVQDIDNKGVQDIAKFIKQKAQKIKKNKGDIEHKKRTSIVNYVPAFMVSIIVIIVNFITSKMSISIPFLALKKDQFGCGCVTSLGALGFEDAYAPFSGFMNYSFLASINATVDTPVVQEGQIKIGKVMNINVGIDHRYVDGGRAKNFIPAFKNVFEKPQMFMKK